jgi:hypothetical protein
MVKRRTFIKLGLAAGTGMLIAPAERADLIADFTGMSGNVTMSTATSSTMRTIR